MVSDALYWFVAVLAAAGWGAFAYACFDLQRRDDRIAALRGHLQYWRNRALHLQSELLDRAPLALIDPEGARIIPFRGKVK